MFTTYGSVLSKGPIERVIFIYTSRTHVRVVAHVVAEGANCFCQDVTPCHCWPRKRSAHALYATKTIPLLGDLAFQTHGWICRQVCLRSQVNSHYQVGRQGHRCLALAIRVDGFRRDQHQPLYCLSLIDVDNVFAARDVYGLRCGSLEGPQKMTETYPLCTLCK